MYDLKKSDAVIVAVKQANNGRKRLAETVEQRAAAEENPEGQRMRRTQSAERVSCVMAVDRIRKAAKRNPEGCLTFRVLPTQRVGIPEPIEASRDQYPTGRWKRPLGTAD